MTAALGLIAWGIVLEARDERERRGGVRERVAPPFRERRPGRIALGRALVGALVLWSSGTSIFAVVMKSSGHAAAATSRREAAPASAMGGMAMAPIQSRASAAPAPAAAARHALVQAEAPPVATGSVVHYTITAEESTIAIAPGVRFRAWTFNGRVPGPVLHVRQGQRVVITFRNMASMPHSLDLHAARVPANVAFRDVPPGGATTFSFIARDPGAFLYHCVTAPALMHIANGMYGALIVEPARPLPPAAHEFVLVASEWYLSGPGRNAPARLDWNKAMAMRPDLVTFNGYADQYADHALHVQPGQLIRFYVVNAGPNLVTPFHLVGGIFDRVYPDGDMTQWLRGVQTTDVAPGGSAAFDARFRVRGLYGFVNHSFASADKGALGAIDVGDVHATMSH